VDELLSFRKMITPILIQVLFWIGLVTVVIGGVVAILGGMALQGLGMIIVGPLVVRVYCELTVVVFKIYETLQSIRDNQAGSGQF
jgi:hypothetical protein